MWRKYLKTLPDINENDSIVWRDKRNGWHDSWAISIKCEQGQSTKYKYYSSKNMTNYIICVKLKYRKIGGDKMRDLKLKYNDTYLDGIPEDTPLYEVSKKVKNFAIRYQKCLINFICL